MLTLALDTSSNSASLGLFEYHQDKTFDVLATRDWEKSKSHSEVITTYTEELLSQCQKSLSDIKLLCIGLGPGSFTGIRVTVNFAKSLAYSLDVPVYAKNSLLPVAFKNKNLASQILVMNNAFRNMVYCSGYKTHPFKEVIPPFSCAPNDLNQYLKGFEKEQNILVIGNGFKLYKSLFDESVLSLLKENSSAQNHLSAQSLFEYFLQDLSPEFVNWQHVVPIYIRGSEAEEKLKLRQE